ncbi:hypothetical protein A2767_05030 [Candidatus Roizmanbacteria bacterium RIFCSPHIGHO2_01_FULL_35_10]|uniref:Methyltransferase domain-containing protein n=1 Tax=Candidatus Roizmanbacteria bacterium RIFCSPLOWO2_01_FULL_35_13 TaxID=1802055 RepID=A0A1F7I6T9_9BACT|nr:MAG: hypothetical protein A2767_05030 [Candidatus Roizmanbacteria bacterium RIFCSPHIGHO2_01_FULL_35_10]OGK39086.1 MAG: hypothetical protein A3A74_05680 [Candidatus Roizmanbacteria bacterium RIFCSPLOWO2_01_FULL_35_13]
MLTQKEYWDKKIKQWSSLAYGKTVKLNVLERIASFFRATNTRKEVTLKLIGPKVKGKTILDLGCGFGEFSISLLMRYGPKKIIAIDISDVAIKEIKKLAKSLKLDEKIELRVEDVTKIDRLPNFDILVGIGLIDYLNSEQLKRLFNLMGEKSFIFSYCEKKLSFLNILHNIYLSIQRGPKFYKYTKKDLRALIPKNSRLFFIKKNGFQFITNSMQMK